MDSKLLIQCFSDIAREKNVDRTELGTILEDLFLVLLEKQYGEGSNCSVIVNIDRGEIEIYHEKTIVEEVDDLVTEIDLVKAQKLEPDLNIGDPFIEVIDPSIFGRRLIATAKQFLSQRIRDVEKKYIFEDYYGRVGEIVIGDVRQVHRNNIYVHIEQSELRIPKEEQIESERFRRGDTIRAIVKSVEMTPKGPDIIASRSDNQFLSKLFEMEVPEIEDGIIEILAIARAAGNRSKIIVRSSDKRIDAVGACVGMRGSRIQAIVRELNGEKIDVINYTSQPEVLITRALSPAKPVNLYIDDAKRYCVALFDDDVMDSAVGKSYHNINLAATVTGYAIDAVRKSEYEGVKKDGAVYLDQVEALTPRMLELLDQAGLHTVSDFSSASREDLLAVKGMGEKVLANITSRIESQMKSVQAEKDGELVQESTEETSQESVDAALEEA
ncbi:MAG: transcription termination factor NusA [Candidatus Neomarinimicrobiota bacterium]